MDEEWLPVVGYEEAYAVSSTGRVRRTSSQKGTAPGRILKPMPDRGGYLRVGVSLYPVKSRVIRGVHQLVAEAFLGERPTPKHIVAHWDGDKTNNAASNLRWATQSENRFDAVRLNQDGNTKKTHCPQGHAYTPENTLVYRRQRLCRACNRDRQRAYQARKRAARGA